MEKLKLRIKALKDRLEIANFIHTIKERYYAARPECVHLLTNDYNYDLIELFETYTANPAYYNKESIEKELKTALFSYYVYVHEVLLQGF
jgi:hypothetical protein